MGAMGWPSEAELNVIRTKVGEMSGRDSKEVRVVVSPYRICPLGAHIDHQGGIVSAMTINRGLLLGFVPSDDSQVLIQSAQFKGEVRFSVNEEQLPRSAAKSDDSQEDCSWGNYARGALYALQKRGNNIKQGIIGYICGAEGLDSSGLSSSAAVGVAYLLAFESANKLILSPTENIEYDRLIENEYLGLKNGILDQSAILLSSYGCLTCVNCKTKEHKLIRCSGLNGSNGTKKQFKILLAFSGLKQALISNPGYNSRVSECREAAKILLQNSVNDGLEPLLSNVDPEAYEEHKCPTESQLMYAASDSTKLNNLTQSSFPAFTFHIKVNIYKFLQFKLDPNLARRAEHYFSENRRVVKGLEAWASGNIEEFGKLISASGLSSIQNYESGCKPLIQLYEILLKAPGVYGARFSGAGFRGCCIAFVDAERALEAASYIKKVYPQLQPGLASQIDQERMVLICDAADCARVI